MLINLESKKENTFCFYTYGIYGMTILEFQDQNTELYREKYILVLSEIPNSVGGATLYKNLSKLLKIVQNWVGNGKISCLIEPFNRLLTKNEIAYY